MNFAYIHCTHIYSDLNSYGQYSYTSTSNIGKAGAIQLAASTWPTNNNPPQITICTVYSVFIIFIFLILTHTHIMIYNHMLYIYSASKLFWISS